MWCDSKEIKKVVGIFVSINSSWNESYYNYIFYNFYKINALNYLFFFILNDCLIVFFLLFFMSKK